MEGKRCAFASAAKATIDDYANHITSTMEKLTQTGLLKEYEDEVKTINEAVASIKSRSKDEDSSKDDQGKFEPKAKRKDEDSSKDDEGKLEPKAKRKAKRKSDHPRPQKRAKNERKVRVTLAKHEHKVIKYLRHLIANPRALDDLRTIMRLLSAGGYEAKPSPLRKFLEEVVIVKSNTDLLDFGLCKKCGCLMEEAKGLKERLLFEIPTYSMSSEDVDAIKTGLCGLTRELRDAVFGVDGAINWESPVDGTSQEE